MKKILPLSTLIVFLFFTPAAAQGPYLGAGLLYNIPTGSDIKFLDPGFGLDFRFGYDFGPVALEGNLMGSRHNDTDPGFGSADFGGFSIDLRVFLSPYNDPDQFYLLVGIGGYSLFEFDPNFYAQGVGANTELSGSGWNLGGGIEHFVNTNLALHFEANYRIIRYDEIIADGVVFHLSPEANGDMLSFQAGINYYF